MPQDIHYRINNERITENKADARLALKEGAKVVKVVRSEYHTGPTRVMLLTATEITKPKEV